MAVVNKVVVKGQSYDIEDAITKKGLSTEATRATEAETELLLRLQGDSENSRASTDPFVNLGNIRGIGELVAYPETIIENNGGTVDAALITAMISGVYRAFFSSSLYEMKLNVFALQGVLTQTITGILKLADGVLSVGTTDVITVERYFQNGNGWSEWKVVVSAEKLEDLGDDIAAAIEKGRALAKRDLFVAAGAFYNDTDAPITRTAPWGESVQHLPAHYYLNGLGDITEAQMTDIYIYTNSYILSVNLCCRFFETTHLKTNICHKHTGWNTANGVIIARLMFYRTGMEVVRLVNSGWVETSYCFPVSDVTAMFELSTNLKTIIGVISCNAQTKGLTSIFNSCTSLENFKIYKLGTNFSCSSSPLVNKNSILYLITNAAPSTAITITLHADAYARLENDADIVAALEAQPLITLVSA